MIDDRPKKQAIERLTRRLMRDRAGEGKRLSLPEWEKLLEKELEVIYEIGFQDGLDAIPPQ